MQNTELPHNEQGGAKPPRQGRKNREGWRSALSTILILVLAPIVAILLTTFVFQSYEVDGPSMEPTLHDGNRLIVWKVPRTIARLTGNPYIPPRGEIIVFSQPNSAEAPDKQLIKRVVALPGERIVVRNNRITIYNRDNPEGFNPDNVIPDNLPPTDGNIDLTVPEGQIFVTGDNRTNSLDSRTFGTVSSDEVLGNLVLRIFPFNRIKTF